MKTTHKIPMMKKNKSNNRTLVKALGIASVGLLTSQLNTSYANTYTGDITAVGCAVCEMNATSDVNIVTDGNITSETHYAIGSSSDGNTSITTAASKLLSGWVGISASTGSGGPSAVDMSITNNSDINSTGSGIDVGDYKFGQLSVVNNGIINSSGSEGIFVSHNNSNNQALTSATTVTTNGAITAKDIGLYASSNASDGLTVNANADISAGQAGIQASTSGSAALTINSSANISATNPDDNYYIRYLPDNKPPFHPEVDKTPGGAINAYSQTTPIQITTAAGKTLTSISNGITARSNSGAVTIDNASDIKTTGFVRETSECSEIAGCTVPENERIAGNGIDVSQALGGSIINNTGNIEVQKAGFLTPAGKVILGGSAIEKVTTTAGTLTGDIELADGNDELNLSGGALIGSANMGLGDDQLNFNGLMDVSQTTQLDGGTAMGIPENPVIVENDVLTADGANFNGFSGSNDISKGVNLTGWETINLINGSVLKLTDNLFESNGTLNIDNTSLIELSGGNPFTIHGSVQNQGYMSQFNGSATNSTIITGDYTGGPESRIYMDVTLNGDDSQADKLIIQGNTSGKTELNVFNADGVGAKTVEGIKIIQVDGASNGQFNLAAPVQAGSYEYTLAKNGLSTPDDGDWYLRSTFTCPVEDPICGGAIIDPTTMFRPAIAAYVAAQTYNADQGLSFMSASHQRIGEQRGLLNNGSKTWARTLLSTQTNKGKTRFEYNQTTTGVQFGHDLLDKTSQKGTTQRAGITAQYAYSRIDTRDRMRPIMGFEDMAGTVGSTLVGVGGYYTRTKNNGGYLDVVAQLNHLRNKFVDVYVGKSTQNAWQTGLSFELGQPVGHIGSWTLEPQAQMSYLYSNYDGIVDAMSIIKSHSTEYLRGRLGLRLAKDTSVNGQQANYYGIANLSHNFINPKVTTQIIDSTDGTLVDVSEKFDTTSLELGAGVQGQIGKTSYLFADARFQRSLNRNKTGAQFNIGFKKSF